MSRKAVGTLIVAVGAALALAALVFNIAILASGSVMLATQFVRLNMVVIVAGVAFSVMGLWLRRITK